jgi:chromosome segregation ATPase
MRLSLVVGLVLAFLLAPAAAQASDASLRSTVKRELTRLGKAEKQFQKVAETVDSDAELDKMKNATEKLGTAVERFHSKVEAEKAQSAELKTARTKLLDASETYAKGLDKLVAALEANSTAKVESALKTIQRAYKKFYSAGKALGSAGTNV